MTICAAIATIVTLQCHDIAYTLVIVWALVAIAIRQMNTPLIAVTSVVMTIVLTLLSLAIVRSARCANELKPFSKDY